MRITRIAAVLLVLTSGLLTAQQAGVTQDRVSAKLRELYPDNADAKKEISEALDAAAKEHKRVLLVFGANWCFDCFALDYRFHQANIQPIVEKNYRVVHVDIGQRDKNADIAKKYNVDIDKGIPALAVVDAKGHLLHNTTEFDSARSVAPDLIVNFLQAWKPTA
jgi:thioredoxin 1